MKRRAFLKTAAALAAGAPLARSYAPSASDQVQHVVVIMMENRAFDHMFGWFPNADGHQAGLSYADQNGNLHPTFPLAPDFTGCAYPNPGHSYDNGRTEYDNGLMDGFLIPEANTVYPIGYYVEADLPFAPALARNYTICDRYFPSILAPTFPNRMFQHAGQTDRLDDSLTISTLPTIWDNLAAAGISHAYYFGNVPFLGLWGGKYINITHRYDDFLAACATGRLPAVSFVDPSFTIVTNLQDDDEPHSDVRNGDAFLSKTFQAISSSPNWPNTVCIINFDESGGFFDHVVPPRAIAPNNVDPDQVDGKALLGIRIPCIIASPWTKGNPSSPTVFHTVCDHTSVLKLIESVWGLPPLGARDAPTDTDVGNLLDALNLANPQVTVPELPMPHPVIPSSLCLSTGISTSDESSAFSRMVSSGMLKGFPGY